MTQFVDTHQRREVSESAFEYLFGEILAREAATVGNDDNSAGSEQRLELLGYSVGYRLDYARLRFNDKLQIF